MFDVKNMRRKTTELIPSGDVLGRAGDNFLRTETGENFVREVAETDAMAVADETGCGPQA